MNIPHPEVPTQISTPEACSSERLARWIRGSGLSVPAAVVLEALKPLSFVGSQLLVLVEPLFGDAGRRAIRGYAAALEDRQGIDALIDRVSAEQTGAKESGK